MGKRILLGTMAVAFIGAIAVIPAVSAFSGEEPAQQSAEMPSVPVICIPTPAPEKPSEPISEPNKVFLYDVPLDTELQIFIIQLCEEHHIDPAIVIAMIERESRFRPGVVGDGGNSFGLMQIQPRWHQERIDRLGVTYLLDPFQNVTVGVDYLAEMIDYCNGDVECALICYNMGPSGAQKYCFSKGIYSSEYSNAVMERARQLVRDVE